MGLPQVIPDLIPQMTQNPVPELPSIQGIDRMELLDIDHDGVHFPVTMIPEDPVSILKKETPVIQSGQPVVLGIGNQLPAFAEFYDPGNSGLDHLMHIEGFRNKISSPQLKSPQFRILFCRQHNNRYASELAVLVYALQYFKAVHFRHDQIQENDGKLIPVRRYLCQCFYPVSGIDQLIIILQDRSQNILIDLLVIHYKNKLRLLQLCRFYHVIPSVFLTSSFLSSGSDLIYCFRL